VAPTIDDQLAALRGQFSRIDLEQLGNEETAQLLTTISKLLRG
jgi:hypothetical protein